VCPPYLLQMADKSIVEADTLEGDEQQKYKKKVKAILTLYQEGRIITAAKKIHSLEKKFNTLKGATLLNYLDVLRSLKLPILALHILTEHKTKFALIQQEASEVKALMEDFSKDEGMAVPL